MEGFGGELSKGDEGKHDMYRKPVFLYILNVTCIENPIFYTCYLPA